MAAKANDYDKVMRKAEESKIDTFAKGFNKAGEPGWVHPTVLKKREALKPKPVPQAPPASAPSPAVKAATPPPTPTPSPAPAPATAPAADTDSGE